MILSAKSIGEARLKGDIAIEPFNQENLKEASYTFTLQDEVTLQPGDFAVGMTREKLTLSNVMCCLLSTRGSIAQMGVDALQTSIVVEPGSDNHLKLEIKNNAKLPVTLASGTPIVKGVFFEVK